MAGLQRMIGEFGETRVITAVTAAIDNTETFAPTLAAIRKYVPKVGVRGTMRETCRRCADSEGWIDAGPDSAGNRAVRLCDHAA